MRGVIRSKILNNTFYYTWMPRTIICVRGGVKRVEDDSRSHNRERNRRRPGRDPPGNDAGEETGTQIESWRTFGYAATTTYHIARPVIAGITKRVETRGAQA